MSRGFYAAASAMMSDMTRFDVIANNLANVNTAGFKRAQSVHHDFRNGFIQRIHHQRALAGVSESGDFEPRYHPLPPAGVGELGTGTLVQNTWNDFQHGALEKTEGPLDVALQSEGFFTLENPAATPGNNSDNLDNADNANNAYLYTRDGAFQRNTAGELVNARGLRVMGQNGPVQISDRSPVQIDENGGVWQNGTQIDTLKITDFDNPQLLLNRGNQLFEAIPGQLAFDSVPVLKQGFLERSNVDVAGEMVNMITAMRAYQISQKALQSEDEMTDKAVNTVGRVG